jgi:hypothetical protein
MMRALLLLGALLLADNASAQQCDIGAEMGSVATACCGVAMVRVLSRAFHPPLPSPPSPQLATSD